MNDVDEDEIGGPWVVQANDGSFTAFFNRMYVPLVSFASWWGHNHHDADEAVGTVMADMHRRWDGIRNPEAYARRAVTWTILKMRRDRHDGWFVPAPNENLPDSVDGMSAFERLAFEQWKEELLAELPPTQYAVFSRFLDGLSMREIADELRKSESTIRQNLRLARGRLRPLIAEPGGKENL
ncbi:MAG: sigma-70 family RNA polymerase sigma factor [Actinoplanes sp.]